MWIYTLVCWVNYKESWNHCIVLHACYKRQDRSVIDNKDIAKQFIKRNEQCRNYLDVAIVCIIRLLNTSDPKS